MLLGNFCFLFMLDKIVPTIAKVTIKIIINEMNTVE